MATNVLCPSTLDSDLTRVLAAYSAVQPVVATEVADDGAVGWVHRLAVIEQVAPERVAPLHGKLIALGLLRFQLLDRTGGMVYRLSPEGRQALAAGLGKGNWNVPDGTIDPGEPIAADHVPAADDHTANDAAP
jgi:hypothetical protein